ncbi:trehalose-phosphatase [Elioraea sp.]|uniref:trehalose-phosphatase n=1 Tax=Elioraea sp. TaxID=2185103 RepID=UPI0025C6CF45|nr:trehalose-phosphatase [Elioraea sp.]
MAGIEQIPPRDIARRGAVFLDFDGTLVEIAPTPEAIRVPPELPGLLALLARTTEGATAILSGRTIETLDRFLSPTRLAAAGEHGAVLRRVGEGKAERQAHLAVPEAWLADAEVLAASRPGAILERKPVGFTLHARGCPEALPAFVDALSAMVAADNRFALLRAHMAVELRPAGTDKGRALMALMAQPPFAGRVPIFVGDDVTDEDAISAALALGGIGLRVADAFGGPEGVRAWLARIVAEGEA